MKSVLRVTFDASRSAELVSLLKETKLKQGKGEFKVWKLDDQVAMEIWSEDRDSIRDFLSEREFDVAVPPDTEEAPPALATALADLGELLVFQESFSEESRGGSEPATRETKDMTCERTDPGASAPVEISKRGHPDQYFALIKEATTEALMKAGKDAVDAAQAASFTCQKPCKHLIDIQIGLPVVTSDPGSTQSTETGSVGPSGLEGSSGTTVTDAWATAIVKWQLTLRCALEVSESPEAAPPSVSGGGGAGIRRCPTLLYTETVRSKVKYQCGTDLTGQTFLVQDAGDACEQAIERNGEKIFSWVSYFIGRKPCPAVTCPNSKIYVTISKPICRRIFGSEPSWWEEFWGVGDGLQKTCHVEVSQFIDVRKVCSA